MKLDRRALQRLLALNDAQLKGVIEGIAAESGLDLADFGISSGDIDSIRRALSMATDEDLKLAEDQMRQFREEKRRRE